MEVIRFLGDMLEKLIAISPPAARGLLKLSIKDELGSFTNLNKVNYNDFLKVLNNSFKNRLIKLNIPSYDKIVNELIYELTRNQSLFTMSGI